MANAQFLLNAAIVTMKESVKTQRGPIHVCVNKVTLEATVKQILITVKRTLVR